MKLLSTEIEESIQSTYESIVLMACEALKLTSNLAARDFSIELEKYVRQECTRKLNAQSSSKQLLINLNSCRPGMAHLTQAIGKLAPYLVWHEAFVGNSSTGFIGRHSHTELIGPNGHSYSKNIRFGFYLQDPYVHYPPHAHEASEIYLLVSGEAYWRIEKREWRHESTGCLIQHESMETHQMKTKEAPLLAIWGWYGDISFESYHFTDD